jgi:hypothetical protein
LLARGRPDKHTQVFLHLLHGFPSLFSAHTHTVATTCTTPPDPDRCRPGPQMNVSLCLSTSMARWAYIHPVTFLGYVHRFPDEHNLYSSTINICMSVVFVDEHLCVSYSATFTNQNKKGSFRY